MIDDGELLRRYAEDKSEPAFAELVQRHVNLVYGAALRRAGGDADLAEDVAQTVFTTLARKAATLVRHPVLVGWLHRSTHYAALDALRDKLRRERHAQAVEIETMNANAPANRNRNAEADWEEVRPVIDSLLDQLNERDRGALLLRFFEGHSFSQIGATLRLTEDAARMRVERALDKLRAALGRRGIRSTTAALGVALANQTAAAAPAGIAASVTVAALAGAAAGAGGTAAAILMSATKLQMGIAAALVVVSTTGFVVQANIRAGLRDEIEAVRRQAAQMVSLRAGNAALQRTATEAVGLRADDAAFARLRDDVEAMRGRLSAAAKRAAPNPAVPASAPVIREVRPVSQAGAVYPPDLLAAGIAGEVHVNLIVTSSGSVANANVVKSTRREFEGPSLEAAKQWLFDPATRNGRAVNTHMLIPITFTPGRGTGEAGRPLPVDVSPPKPAEWF